MFMQHNNRVQLCLCVTLKAEKLNKKGKESEMKAVGGKCIIILKCFGYSCFNALCFLPGINSYKYVLIQHNNTKKVRNAGYKYHRDPWCNSQIAFGIPK